MEGAIEPPPGVTPNLIHPVSLRKYNVLGQTVCLTISTLLVWMRMYSKLCLIKSVGWEDCKSTTKRLEWIMNTERVKILASLPGYLSAHPFRSIVVNSTQFIFVLGRTHRICMHLV